jgi:hypothetical protein
VWFCPETPWGGGYIAGPLSPSQGFFGKFAAQTGGLGVLFRFRMALKEKAFAIILGTG